MENCLNRNITYLLSYDLDNIQNDAYDLLTKFMFPKKKREKFGYKYYKY